MMLSLGLFGLWNDNIDKGANANRTSSSDATPTTARQRTIVYSVCLFWNDFGKIYVQDTYLRFRVL